MIGIATMESLPAAFFLLLPAAPLVLVYAAGIIVALLKKADYPMASAFALTGFSGLLMGTLIRGTATLMTLPEYRGDMSITELGIQLAAINFLATFLTVAATVFLIVAIFTGRERSEGLRKRWET
jgi:formate hydrogenlyase subunit 3/multisubunit Na+/H+ antiporter MnhD subunit